ncbi:hypothetical protein BaRGS_00035375 [Batillaria attramentaria]|uniref:PiggyBac transposable element-derived protein 4 C-terminal zinc-ribbon domain-containing protein n=1 Tax=Batillaria attramentaria TaxID=370345 RepID=A0ABD0JG37_9CAEN
MNLTVNAILNHLRYGLLNLMHLRAASSIIPLGFLPGSAVLVARIASDVTTHEWMEGSLASNQAHFLARIPATKNRIAPQKRCRVCYNRGLRRDSCYICPVCPKQPGLCRIGDCFKRMSVGEYICWGSFASLHAKRFNFETLLSSANSSNENAPSVADLPFLPGIGGCGAALMTEMVDIFHCGMDHGLIPPHHLARIPATKMKENPLKRCRVCYKRGQRRDSYFHCPACPTQPGLCKSRDCFDVFHQFMQQDLIVDRSNEMPHSGVAQKQ